MNNFAFSRHERAELAGIRRELITAHVGRRDVTSREPNDFYVTPESGALPPLVEPPESVRGLAKSERSERSASERGLADSKRVYGNERQRIENHLRICLIPRHQPSATLPATSRCSRPSAAAKRFHPRWRRASFQGGGEYIQMNTYIHVYMYVYINIYVYIHATHTELRTNRHAKGTADCIADL